MFNLIILYDMFILQISIVSFLQQCEANILVALIEGCVGGGGVSGDVVTSCCWNVGNGCLFKLLLIIFFQLFF